MNGSWQLLEALWYVYTVNGVTLTVLCTFCIVCTLYILRTIYIVCTLYMESIMFSVYTLCSVTEQIGYNTQLLG